MKGGFFLFRAHKTSLDNGKRLDWYKGSLHSELASSTVLALFTGYVSDEESTDILRLLTSQCVPLSHELFQCPSLVHMARPFLHKSVAQSSDNLRNQTI